MSALNLPSVPTHAPGNHPRGAPRQPNRPNPPGTGKIAQKHTLNNGKAYTSKLRSVTPLARDDDSKRTRDRLATGGTATDLAEEGYRVCRLNASLRRDLDEARKQVRAPMSDDNDSARIKSRLDCGATAQEIAEEAYRVCRVNSYLKKNKDGAQGEVRVGKKKEAVMEDALQEMRAELPELRMILERSWGLLQSHKVAIPEDLGAAYSALMAKDGHDWQARKGMKEDVRLTKGRKEQGKKGKKGAAEAKDKKPGGQEKVTFLLHTQQGKTYNLREPNEDEDDKDEDEDEEIEAENGDAASSTTEAGDVAEMMPSLAGPSAEHVTTPQDDNTITLGEGAKRKATEDLGGALKKTKTDSSADTDTDDTASKNVPTKPNPFSALKRKPTTDIGADSKKIKLNTNDSFTSEPDFWKSKINLSAHETWDEDVKLTAPPFPFQQSWDSASRAMYRREKGKGRQEKDGEDLEEGEISE